MADPPPSPWQTGMRDAGPYLGLAWQILSAMLVFGGGGLWLDAHFGWTPWGLLGGMGLSFVGIAALLYRVVTQANAVSRRRAQADRAKAARSGVEGSVKAPDADIPAEPNRP